MQDVCAKQVYLFGTCLVDVFFPQAGMDALALIEQAGVRVHFPDAQSCCGQPAYTSGYPDEARRVAWSQIRLFPNDWPIIVLSGSCAGMMKHHYPKLFERGTTQWAAAQDVSRRVVELTDYLVNDLDIQLNDLGPAIKVALHTACSARREMETLQCGLALLDRLRHVQLMNHEREAECCGFGGTFSIKHPAISAAMVADKVQALLDCGAQQLVSADCGCLLNINGALAHRGEALQGEHIISFVRRRCEGGV
ncbi:L-lactate dehydrogenase complex protein LldE [Chitinivorax tropicus]|uniref:L-lactate dehydrogenase complex protein LldE n=1 Tax=Chitinivorax tropicus TaxID=714531 RepID=A0A840MP69_9PROT|nr:(Fe-S)-binding protein [Chitinivorax tropicus]MBB5017973.1 L-lactate dehydrogenase complex protein LldE [Chitinivorax tropicus]